MTCDVEAIGRERSNAVELPHPTLMEEFPGEIADLFAKHMSLVALNQYICHWSDGPNGRPGMAGIQEFAEAEIVTVRAENPVNWLIELSDEDTKSSIDGLILVKEFRALQLPPEQYEMMEKAESYEAHSVFFEASRNNRSQVAQAFIYVSDQPGASDEFALLHKRLWSWGGVPLLYRKTPGKVELFRCASKADFDQSSEIPKYRAYDTLTVAADIANAESATAAWWDFGRLRNGTLWDDPTVCERLLSDTASAHRHLVGNIFGLYKTIKAVRYSAKACSASC